jgi:anti-anti-sigma factor
MSLRCDTARSLGRLSAIATRRTETATTAGAGMQPTIDDADFSLEIHHARDGHETTVLVAGALDLTTADQLEEAVRIELRRGPVRVDLSAVSFIDSSGLRALDALARDSRAGDDRLRIDPALPDSVAQILELTGMMGILPFAEAR